MTVTNYLCIGCPMGCHLEVEHKEEEIIEIRGSSCKRGKEFAQQEHTDPRRMVTTTVRVLGGLWPKLPVKTTEAIPKGKVVELCKELLPHTPDRSRENGRYHTEKRAWHRNRCRRVPGYAGHPAGLSVEGETSISNRA